MKKVIILALSLLIGFSVYGSDRSDMKKIDMLYKAKEYGVAIDELKDFIGKYPKTKYRMIAIDRLAKTLYVRKEYNESIKYFKELLKIKSLTEDQKDEGRYYLGRAYGKVKKLDEERKIVNEISKTYPKKGKAVFLLGKDYFENKEYENSNKVFKLLEKKKEFEEKSRFYLSLGFYNLKKYKEGREAIKGYLAISNDNKGRELTTYLLCKADENIGNQEKTIKSIDLYIKEFPNGKNLDKVALIGVETKVKAKEIEKAEKYIVLMKSEESKDEGYELIGNDYFLQKNYKVAIKYYEKIKDSKRIEATLNLGISYYSESTKDIKLRDKGKRKFEKLVGTIYDTEGRYYLALIANEEKKYNEVIKALTNIKGKKIEPEYIENIVTLKGKAYEQLKKYNEGSLVYENEYRRVKKPKSLYEIIYFQNILGNEDKLVKYFNEYKKEFPEDKEYKEDIYLIVGTFFHKKKEYTKGKEVYEGYLKKKESKEIKTNLILLLTESEDYKELVKVLKTEAKTLENQMLIGKAYLALTMYKEAGKEFLEVINDEKSKEEDREKAVRNLGKAKFMAKKYVETLDITKKYKNKIKTKEGRLEIEKLKGLSLLRLERYKEARTTFEAISKIKGEKGYGLFQIGETYYNQGNYSEALKSYKEVYTLKEAQEFKERSLYNIVSTNYLIDNYKEVIKNGTEYLKKYPKSEGRENINIWMARSYEGEKENQSAIDKYKDIYNGKGDPKVREDAVKSIVVLYYNDGKIEESKSWIKLLKNSGDRYFYTGVLYEKKNDRKKAEENFLKLVDDKEYSGIAKSKLGRLYYEEKKYDAAEKMYKKNLDDGNGIDKDLATYQLGEIMIRKENYKEALKYFIKLRVYYKESKLNKEGNLKIGELYEKEKRPEEAIATYERFLKEYPKDKYETLVLKSLIRLNLEKNNNIEGKKYYERLKKIDKKESVEYDKFF